MKERTAFQSYDTKKTQTKEMKMSPKNNTVDFDVDLLDEMITSAPTAGYGPNVNFGKCTFNVQIMAWSGAKGEQRKLNARPFKAGEKLKDGEYLQVEFLIDVTELNPQLQNPYKRRVDIKKSGPKAKTDWTETVEPSLKKVFGANWSKALAKGAYVMVEDAETVQLDKDGKPRGFTSQTTGNFVVNSAPRFVAVYKSKTECEAARAERFASKNNDDLVVSDGGIPENVIADVRGLMEAVEDDELRNILTSAAPYNEYDVEELIAAASA